MQLPGVPKELLQALMAAAAGRRLALVGGAVRDVLLHRVHNDPWRALPDLDLVVEGTAAEIAADAPDQRPALAMALALQQQLGTEQVPAIREHGRFGTVELQVELEQRLPGAGTWLLDIASARQESYPGPGQNPLVKLGWLEDDLARRDFSVNAIALVLDAAGRRVHLLDPHHGQADLAARQLRILHAQSLSDDPTRLLRGARYAARLGFSLSPCSLSQARTTLTAWPWGWHPGNPPTQAPPALGPRLRMELDLLLEREPWPEALALLQNWGAMELLDSQLQRDQHWRRRLHWAQRLQLPRPAALLAGAADPLALAERLQLPHRQQRLLRQWLELKARLSRSQDQPDRPSAWCRLLEAPGCSIEAVALAIACGDGPRRPLLRWWLYWRYVKAPITATELLAAGNTPGPALGARLRQERAALLDALPNRSEVAARQPRPPREGHRLTMPTVIS